METNEEEPSGLPNEDEDQEIAPLGVEDEPEPEHDPSHTPGEGGEGDSAG